MLVVSPFLLAFVGLWLVLAAVLFRYIADQGGITYITAGCLAGLTILLYYPGKHVLVAIRGLSSHREITCLEK